MSHALVIVESPAKAKTIGGFLGRGYVVVASMGHVRDLPRRSLGVDVDQGFQPHYEIVPGKGKIVRQIQEAARQASCVYLAADHDREGEAISWHVKCLLPHDGTPVLRVVFNEITRAAILRAMEAPGPLDMNKVDAQQARRILDRLVGYKVSPFLWRTLRTTLSAGRVQSVALRLVCEREEEILSFRPQEYWVIKAVLGTPEGTFEATLATIQGKKAQLSCEEEAKETAEALAGQKPVVASVAGVVRATKPPPPFITSSLQQEASVRLGFSPERTMRVAQELYEGLEVPGEGHVGLITYMRTDSFRVAQEAQDQARALIATRWGQDFVPPRPPTYASRKLAQEAHEAIRPTDVGRLPEALAGSLTRDQARLYELIWRRFIASQMAPERVKVTTVNVEAGPFGLRATGLERLFPGHTVVWPSGKEEQHLPPLSEGQELSLLRVEPSQHFTKPRPRFTEASLIKELEARGIGRPSTYATIVATLRQRKYVEKQDKSLVPTELGKAVNTILVDRFPDVFAVGFTAQMEEDLDRVERGEASWVDVVGEFWDRFKVQLADAERAQAQVRRLLDKHSDEHCPQCGKPLVIRMGRYGSFKACTGFPSCRYTAPLKEERPSQAVCPKCQGPMVVKEGRFGQFLACASYPQCDGALPLGTGVPCPREGCSGELVAKRSKKGRRFYGCTAYPQCTFVTWREPVASRCPHCQAGAAARVGRGKRLVCLRCGEEVPAKGQGSPPSAGQG